MNTITKNACAGTLESSDLLVELSPGSGGIELELESVVMNQFGDEIRRVVESVLREQGVDSARVRVVDQGALECVIRARVETAVLRAREG